MVNGRWVVDAHALGDIGLQTAKWGPSVGVFQIRSLKDPSAYSGLDRLRVRSKLTSATYNAEVAYKMSASGTRWTAWSVFNSGAYKAHVGRQDAIVENWAGLPAAGGGGGDGTSVTGRQSAYDFVALALKQVGDSYVYGAEASLSSSDPSVFDCSELVQWAAARVGCFMPDGSSNQMNYMRSKGTTCSVTEAKRVRGALLWKPGHIAISLGDGRTVEALNPSYGVVVMGSSRSFSWEGAGRIPGMRYG
jgi:cell wall-associated NlpC family hydrolase